MSPEERAAALAAMSPEERAAALAGMHMSPEERAAALAAMSPEERAAALPGMIPRDTCTERGIDHEIHSGRWKQRGTNSEINLLPAQHVPQLIVVQLFQRSGEPDLKVGLFRVAPGLAKLSTHKASLSTCNTFTLTMGHRHKVREECAVSTPEECAVGAPANHAHHSLAYILPELGHLSTHVLVTNLLSPVSPTL